MGGSDLHVTAERRPLVRLDGVLLPIPGADVWSASFVETAIRSVMGADRWARFEQEPDCDFALELPNGLRFRVNVYRQRGFLGAALRRLPARIRGLKELGLPERLGELAELPRGLVLVTGRSGVGKSTTLAALIDRINRTRNAHVVTIEDPIEFVHPEDRALIHQREIGVDTPDYPTALRQVLRQDPDVVLLGELRDLETISGALSAAETGHLVLATLHTQSAAQTVDRIVDVFPARQQNQVRAQLALTLKAAVSQELVPRIGGGRAVAAEVMIATPAISSLIRDGRHHQIPAVMMAGGGLGMQTMDQALAKLVLDGAVDTEAALRVAHHHSALTSMVRHATPSWGPDAVPSADLPRIA